MSILYVDVGMCTYLRGDVQVVNVSSATVRRLSGIVNRIYKHNHDYENPHSDD